MISARELDANDVLAPFHARFTVEDPSLIYLDGNSLGRMPIEAARQLELAIHQGWGTRLIESWGEGWYDLPQRLGEKIGKIIGARSGEVLCCDSTSVNFYKLAHAALANRDNGRNRVVTDNLNFPSDLYLLQGLCNQLGCTLHVVESKDGIHVRQDQIAGALEEHTALLSLSHVAFKSGFRHDVPALTQAAHHAGALTLWDLSHSVGAVQTQLDEWEVDLAVGCTYKYLNGGPGSPAFLYVRSELQDRLRNPIWGWFGQTRPFDFDTEYVPAAGIDRFLAGTPPILSMIAVEAGLDLILEAGVERIEAKSTQMFQFFHERWHQELAELGIAFGSPISPGMHGSHATLTHNDAYAIDQALIHDHRVIPDFRAPDGIRFGFTPLYTTFGDLERAVDAVKHVVMTESYRTSYHRRGEVT